MSNDIVNYDRSPGRMKWGGRGMLAGIVLGLGGKYIVDTRKPLIKEQLPHGSGQHEIEKVITHDRVIPWDGGTPAEMVDLGREMEMLGLVTFVASWIYAFNYAAILSPNSRRLTAGGLGVAAVLYALSRYS